MKDIFKFLVGKYNEIDKPIFTKPYVDKTYDMLELARRLDKAPEETKPIFREAMETMAARIKAHQTIHDLLEKSDLPVLILYDLHILCSAGAASIDYVVLSNRFVLALSCPSQEDGFTAEESRASAAPGEHHHLSSSEHSALILTEMLRDEKLLNKKDLKMVWPITVLPEPSSDQTFDEPLGTFTSTQSRAYPEIRRAQTVRPADLIDYIKKLFQFDDAYTWVSNTDLYHISSALLTYDKKATDNGDKEEG